MSSSICFMPGSMFVDGFSRLFNFFSVSYDTGVLCCANSGLEEILDSFVSC